MKLLQDFWSNSLLKAGPALKLGTFPQSLAQSSCEYLKGLRFYDLLILIPLLQGSQRAFNDWYFHPNGPDSSLLPLCQPYLYDLAELDAEGDCWKFH